MKVARKYWAVCISAAVLLCFIILLQPLAPRFEGWTAAEWIEYYASNARPPETAVVEFFGERALRPLLRKAQPAFLFGATQKLDDRLGTRTFLPLRDRDFDRRMVCAQWAERLYELDPLLLEKILASSLGAGEQLAAGRLILGEVGLAAALRQHAQTNAQLQARSIELLELYRAAF